MLGAMKPFLKKFMWHKIFSCIVPGAAKYFLKNLQNLLASPATYLMYTSFLKKETTKKLVKLTNSKIYEIFRGRPRAFLLIKKTCIVDFVVKNVS